MGNIGKERFVCRPNCGLLYARVFEFFVYFFRFRLLVVELWLKAELDYDIADESLISFYHPLNRFTFVLLSESIGTFTQWMILNTKVLPSTTRQILVFITFNLVNWHNRYAIKQISLAPSLYYPQISSSTMHLTAFSSDTDAVVIVAHGCCLIILIISVCVTFWVHILFVIT